ncbi:tryptophan synthase subunit alpha [Streptomyces brevispora]|uniref:Tryptophan synthase alpha chain n=1 Tax=Streptomyces brevispora TaxID=887462 RepID=A0A561USX6_9ACTN|nr:tryptophan synthase subunit alpha [Streptomyces brevispora]TWG02470.1 tryptophan synthase alpha chain [Streptomyces brevispora]WSC16371.1 tryptophan synthase subunit alpha [Streptomyces brevispora]
MSGQTGHAGNTALLSATLAKAKSEDRAALIAYLPAGFPTVDGGIAAIKAVAAGGADVVEVGLPHSDPVLDGPVIQTADDIALRGGVKIADVMRTVREAYEATGIPILVMTYWNPIDRYGVERFTAELAEAGGAGCILPDLPVQESALWREHAGKHGLATVFVVAPSSKDERLATITAAGSGFVYAASLMGVTGTRVSVGEQAQELVRRTRATTGLPVCVGLGVSNAEQATEVAGFADGVIVGSAFVKRMLDAPDEAAGLAAVRSLAADLAEGVRKR